MKKFNEEMARIFNAMKVFNQYMGGYELESVKGSLLIIDEINNDLYAALKRYVDEYGEWEESVTAVIGRQPETGIHLEQAKAALAKAEGRTE